MTGGEPAFDEITVPVELPEVVDHISYQRVVENAGSDVGLFPRPFRPRIRAKPR